MQDVQDMSPLPSLKKRNTGECVYALWTLKVSFVPLFFFLFFSYICRHSYRRVAEVGWRRTRISFFFLLFFFLSGHVDELCIFLSLMCPRPNDTYQASIFFFIMGRERKIGRTSWKCSDGSSSVRNWSELDHFEATRHSRLSFFLPFVLSLSLFLFVYFYPEAGRSLFHSVEVKKEKKEPRLWCKKRVHECWDSCVQHTT